MGKCLARFYVARYEKDASNPEAINVVLRAAGRGEQNKEWAKWTPSGELKMHVNHPGGAQFFIDALGQDLALTFETLGDEHYPSEHADKSSEQFEAERLEREGKAS